MIRVIPWVLRISRSSRRTVRYFVASAIALSEDRIGKAFFQPTHIHETDAKNINVLSVRVP